MGKGFFSQTKRTPSSSNRKISWKILSHDIVPDYTVDLTSRALVSEEELNRKASILSEKYQIIQKRVREFKKK